MGCHHRSLRSGPLPADTEARRRIERDPHEAGGVLMVRVRDDGAGGASRGSGLTGLRDRAEAVGGSMTVHSPPGTVQLPATEDDH